MPKDIPKQDALLEIGTEEIPASYMPPALAHMKSFAEGVLKDKKLPFEAIRSYGTPRRLTIHIAGIPPKSGGADEEIWGPSLKAAKDPQGQWTQAAKGFAESKGASVQDLQVRPTKKGEYLCILRKHPGTKSEEVLTRLFSDMVPSIPFPKKMVWNSTRFKFARPIRNLVALYGSRTLRLSAAGVKSSNKTFSLSHLSSKRITISTPQNYVTALKNNCVLADPELRRDTVLKSASDLAKKVNGRLKTDEQLLQEVVWLVEHPVAVLGNFDNAFLELSQEVLSTCMRKHQKFFSVLDRSGKLLPHFIAVRNGISEHQDIVRKGYEKVLTARLTDAKFFFEEDMKKPLESYLEKCSGVMLQEKLGSVTDKVKRMGHVGEFCVRHIPPGNGLDPAVVQRAIALCKFDLTTSMVYEFAELQGIMGGIYASRWGENGTVAEAIKEHYLPITPQGELPRSREAGIVSLADKMDGLVGNFMIGRLPSGNSDPYGLRRQSTGILRIMLENRWDFSLSGLAQDTFSHFNGASDAAAVLKGVNDFLLERFQLLMQDAGFAPDEIAAVIRNAEQADCRELKVTVLQEKIAALHEVRGHPDFEAVAGAYKRASNILRQARAKGISYGPGTFNESLIKEEAERGLYAVLTQVREKTGHLLAGRKFKETLQECVKLRASLDLFFEKVMVMDPDPALATNRLSLLSILESVLKEIAEFSQLQNRGD